MTKSTTKTSPFTCPVCGQAVPFSKVWALNNNSIYCCSKCQTEIVPKKMSTLYFVVAFIATAGTGKLLMSRFDSLPPIMLGAVLAGFIVYLIGIVYAYKTVSFRTK